MKYTPTLLLAAVAAAGAFLPTVAFAQKPGGILKMYHRGNPPSASIHEEATTSTVMPFDVQISPNFTSGNQVCFLRFEL